MDRYDVCVVGAGSAGFAAALAAARAGVRTVLIERDGTIGGTAVNAGVTMWEAGVGGTGFPAEIYSLLKGRSDAVGVYGYGRHCVWQGLDVFPGGEHVLRPEKGYADTLRRHGMHSLREDEKFARENIFGVVFEPESYAAVLRKMLAETNRCDIMTDTLVSGATAEDDRVLSVSTEDTTIEARYFVDCTGSGFVCREAGCRTTIGREARSEYDEPSAPEAADSKLNGVSLLFRISPRDEETVDPLPQEVPAECWWAERYPVASFTQYPRGGYNVNVLPVMPGEEYAESPAAAYNECRRRILSFWHWVQDQYPEFRRYTMSRIFPTVGVREDARVICTYMLKEQDVLAGIGSSNFEDTVTIADHALDRHGEKGGCTELKEPFAIPYRCLVPERVDNLLVAGRSAGFSSIAASSCRLSRTMMQLGQAAGTAVSLAAAANLPVASVPSRTLRDRLRSNSVSLEWPTEGFITRAIAHV